MKRSFFTLNVLIIVLLSIGITFNPEDGKVKQYSKISENDVFKDKRIFNSNLKMEPMMANNGNVHNNDKVLAYDSIVGNFNAQPTIIKASNGCNTEYGKGWQEGLEDCKVILSNFSGQKIAICDGIGPCGGQTYRVGWGYKGSKRLNLVIDPKLFDRVEFNYNTTMQYEYYATGKENAERDGYHCAWNNSYNIYLIDSVTGQEYPCKKESGSDVGYIDIDVNYPNLLLVEARWFFKPKVEKANCIANAYTNSVRVRVR